MAHGNDGAGSIRIPASCCGLVGLKPSRGRTPAGPHETELLFGMAYEFALARTVRDVAHLLDAVQGAGLGDKVMAIPPVRPYADEVGAPPPRLRVALATTAFSGVPVDPECAGAAQAVAAHLAERQATRWATRARRSTRTSCGRSTTRSRSSRSPGSPRSPP